MADPDRPLVTNGPFRPALSREEGGIDLTIRTSHQETPRRHQTSSDVVVVETTTISAPVQRTCSAVDMAKVPLIQKPCASMLPHPTWLSSLQHVHPMIMGVFPITEVVSPLAGRIQKFLANWKLLTTDKNILNIVKGWEVPLLCIPTQTRLPQAIKMNSLEEKVMDQEIESMLAKGAIREAIPKSDQFLSNVFVTPKKEEGEY